MLSDDDITDEREDEDVCGVLGPARVDQLFSMLNADAIQTSTPGQSVQQALDGKAGALHNHAAGDINSGRLAPARLPTSDTANRVLRVGAADSDPAYGQVALGADVSGTLPAGNGGTGQTSLQETRNAMGLGNTTGPLPVANGGTGATAAAAARTNLGINAFAARAVLTGSVAPTFAANSTITAAVTFNPPFGGTPTVLVSSGSSMPNQRISSAASISSTGFTVYLYCGASAGVTTVFWMAFY